MNKSKGIVLVIAATMLTVGLASTAAGWRSSVYEGGDEPNTGDAANNLGDYDPEAMYQSSGPAQDTGNDTIYFDSVTDKWFFPFVTSPNAGSGHTAGIGVADTDARNYGVTYFHAYLGYWRDCNGDGFIGDAATGAAQYPSALQSGCASGTAYNDGTTTYEFLAIGPNARDVSQGTVGSNVCPNPDGGPSNDNSALGTPRHNPSDPNNVVCPGGNSAHFVQDDFAKVWHDWGFPKDEPATTRLLFPLPDGTLRDSNGNFRYVDSLTFGSLSGTDSGCATTTAANTAGAGDPTNGAACLVWPSHQESTDPAQGQQCENNAARSGQYDTSNLGDVRSNAETGTEEVLEAATGTDAGQFGECSSSSTKSPVPNVRSVSLATFTVDWPSHTVEERYNNSEAPNKWGTPVTEPVGCSGPKTSNQADDWDGDSTDGDPLYNYSQGQEVSYAQSLVAGDGGPAVQPTADKLAGATLFFAGVNGQCYGSTGDPTPYDNLELAEQPAVSGKVQADTPFGFTTDTHFNPSHVDSSGSNTFRCVQDNAALFDHPVRCNAQWFSFSQWFHSHGTTSLALPQGLTASWTATFYADVSAGNGSGQFEGVSDKEFDPADDGVFPLSPETAGGVWDPQFAFQAEDLPGDADDDHQYGDAACGTITNLFGGAGPTDGDHFAKDELSGQVGGWDCDRTNWAQAAALPATPSDPQDEKDLWLLPKVGDPFDLRDADCYDNDIRFLGETLQPTDTGNLYSGTAGNVAQPGPSSLWGTNCENLGDGKGTKGTVAAFDKLK